MSKSKMLVSCVHVFERDRDEILDTHFVHILATIVTPDGQKKPSLFLAIRCPADFKFTEFEQKIQQLFDLSIIGNGHKGVVEHRTHILEVLESYFGHNLVLHSEIEILNFFNTVLGACEDKNFDVEFVPLQEPKPAEPDNVLVMNVSVHKEGNDALVTLAYTYRDGSEAARSLRLYNCESAQEARDALQKTLFLNGGSCSTHANELRTFMPKSTEVDQLADWKEALGEFASLIVDARRRTPFVSDRGIHFKLVPAKGTKPAVTTPEPTQPTKTKHIDQNSAFKFEITPPIDGLIDFTIIPRYNPSARVTIRNVIAGSENALAEAVLAIELVDNYRDFNEAISAFIKGDELSHWQSKRLWETVAIARYGARSDWPIDLEYHAMTQFALEGNVLAEVTGKFFNYRIISHPMRPGRLYVWIVEDDQGGYAVLQGVIAGKELHLMNFIDQLHPDATAREVASITAQYFDSPPQWTTWGYILKMNKRARQEAKAAEAPVTLKADATKEEPTHAGPTSIEVKFSFESGLEAEWECEKSMDEPRGMRFKYKGSVYSVPFQSLAEAQAHASALDSHLMKLENPMLTYLKAAQLNKLNKAV